MKRFVFTLLLSCCGIQFCHATEVSPTQVATQFYDWVISHDDGGLPRQQSLTQIRDLLSVKLNRLLRQSLVVEQRCIKAAPMGTKPLMFEGSIFVGNLESLTKVISLKEEKRNGRVILTAHLAYSDPKSAAEVDWLDQLTLVRENTHWVIHNIRFSGESPTLVDLLKTYTSKKECGV